MVFIGLRGDDCNGRLPSLWRPHGASLRLSSPEGRLLAQGLPRRALRRRRWRRPSRGAPSILTRPRVQPRRRSLAERLGSPRRRRRPCRLSTCIHTHTCTECNDYNIIISCNKLATALKIQFEIGRHDSRFALSFAELWRAQAPRSRARGGGRLPARIISREGNIWSTVTPRRPFSLMCALSV